MSVNLFDGYDSWSSLDDFTLSNGFKSWEQEFPSSSTDPQYKLVETQETVWVPPTEYIPAIPSIAATPTQIKYEENTGWNTWARSVDQLAKGTFYVFTCPQANEGFFLGVGDMFQLGNQISLFSHGLLVDASGIRVYEGGTVKHTLTTSFSSLSKIRIYRQADGSIVYAVTNGSDTYLYESLEEYATDDAYIYGYIYSSNDRILTSSFKSGSVQYSNCTMDAISRLSFDGSKLILNGTSTLFAGGKDSSVTFAASSSLVAFSAGYTHGEAYLQGLVSIGGDASFNGFGRGSASLPSLYAYGSGGQYIPETLQTGSAFLPALISTGLLITSAPGSGDVTIPALFSKGGEGNYGFGSATLQGLKSYGTEGAPKGTAEIFSLGYAVSGCAGYREVVVLLGADGTISGTITGTKEYVATVLETLNASDSYSTLGNYLVSIEETINGTMLATATIAEGEGGEGVGVDTTARVWVVNMNNNASCQYDGYGFNAFFTEDGVDYGIADDGIYRLDGDTDGGNSIAALIEIGLTNFGDPQEKKLINLYVGASSDEKLYLKAEADGQTYVYELRSNSADSIKQHRADLGKGLKGVLWNLTLLNQDGSDFVLSTVTFEPFRTSRRI